MAFYIFLALFAIGGLWFGRRFAPALLGACVALLAPLWLIGGFIWDLVPGFLQRFIVWLLMLPLTPFIFLWSWVVGWFNSDSKKK